MVGLTKLFERKRVRFVGLLIRGVLIFNKGRYHIQQGEFAQRSPNEPDSMPSASLSLGYPAG